MIAFSACFAGARGYFSLRLNTIRSVLEAESNQASQKDLEKVEAEIKPVSYTHLTLPTKRIV